MRPGCLYSLPQASQAASVAQANTLEHQSDCVHTRVWKKSQPESSSHETNAY